MQGGGILPIALSPPSRLLGNFGMDTYLPHKCQFSDTIQDLDLAPNRHHPNLSVHGTDAAVKQQVTQDIVQVLLSTGLGCFPRQKYTPPPASGILWLTCAWDAPEIALPQSTPHLLKVP